MQICGLLGVVQLLVLVMIITKTNKIKTKLLNHEYLRTKWPLITQMSLKLTALSNWTTSHTALLTSQPPGQASRQRAKLVVLPWGSPMSFERDSSWTGAPRPAHALHAPGRDLDPENTTPLPTQTMFPWYELKKTSENPPKTWRNTLKSDIKKGLINSPCFFPISHFSRSSSLVLRNRWCKIRHTEAQWRK